MRGCFKLLLDCCEVDQDARGRIQEHSVGVMFAPRHQTVAEELVRVTRPGGTIGLVNWTPDGLIGQLLKTLAPYAPPPAPGASPASL